MIDCTSIKNLAIEEYPDHTTKTFMTLGEYLVAAERATKYFIKLLRPELMKEVTSSEDVIALVANAMMIADWKWEPNHGRTQHSFRNDYACYAIRSYITRRYKNKKNTISLDDIILKDRNRTRHDFVEDTESPDVFESVFGSEKDHQIQKMMNFIKGEKLTPQESYCMSEYYVNDKTYKEIGQTIGVTKQRIEQVIRSAKEKMIEAM